MVTYKFILYTLLAVVFTFAVHEFSHWTVGELLGNEMRMTLNTGYPIAGRYVKDWHYPVVSAAGPLVTLLQGTIFYFLIKRYSNKNLFPFLFTCFYLELLSGVLNYRNPNDLGRIGTYLSIGLYTLPILFTAMQFMLSFKTCRREHYGWKFILTTFLLVFLFSSAWIGLNQKFHVIII
jgi:hypothetical protein